MAVICIWLSICVSRTHTVKRTKAVMVYEDGNGNELARQEIPYTDLPIEPIPLYACWDGEHWVIMLPSEY